MKPTVGVCFFAALLLGGASARGQSVYGEAPKPSAQPTKVVLTNDHPEGVFIIAPEVLAARPPVLALTFTRVVNPAKTSVQMLVYLSYRPGAGAKSPAAPVKIPLGNVGLYPPDRPAGFLLRASAAFAKIQAASEKASDVRLQLEMKRIHADKPWTPIEVTVAPPEWRDEPGP